MGVLLDAVSPDDWCGVVTGALQAAKVNHAQARTSLAQYLIARPEGRAPTPRTVVIHQLNGADQLVNRLADPLIEREKFPLLHVNDAQEAYIWGQVASELSQKISYAQLLANPKPVRVSGDLDP